MNNKQALNFVLKDPTPMKYIDPEFWIHNEAGLQLLAATLSNKVHSMPVELDQQIITRWCNYHSFSLATINQWFIGQE